jgi:hypothetical protein
MKVTAWQIEKWLKNIGNETEIRFLLNGEDLLCEEAFLWRENGTFVITLCAPKQKASRPPTLAHRKG